MSIPKNYYAGGMSGQMPQQQSFSQMPMGQNNYGNYRNNMAFGQMPQNNMNSQNNYSSHRNMIPGRMVDNEEDIQFNEIPMDRSFSTFITNDLQHVYLKTVGGDGKVYTNIYNLQGDGQEAAQNPLDLIMERLDRLEEMLKKPVPVQNNLTNHYRKQEEKSNE